MWVWYCCLWGLCTNMLSSANANCGPIIWTAHAEHVPPVALWIDGPCGDGAPGQVGLTDLKSVERQFLLIFLNQWRQMQPIHNSGKLWILHWALTYITMTSKHNFRGHVFILFALPSLFLSSLSQSHPARVSCPPPHTHNQRVVDKSRSGKINKRWLIILIFCSCEALIPGIW